MIIPEGTNRVKRFTIPRLIVPMIILSVVCALGMAGYWFLRYQQVVEVLPNLQALRQQNQRQEAQITAFASRLASFKRQMSQLANFNNRLRAMADLGTPKVQETIFGVGGPEGTPPGGSMRLSSNVRERQLSLMQRDLDTLAMQWEAQRSVQKELAKFLKDRRSVLASTPSIWPTRGWVTSGFGYRISPFSKTRTFHAGLDISTRRGSRIVAPAAGVVTFVGSEGGYGKMLAINHGNGLVTRYGHLYRFKVKAGQKVKRGQIIGLVGNSGRSTGPHLHYEVLLAGVPTNPRYYILD